MLKNICTIGYWPHTLCNQCLFIKVSLILQMFELDSSFWIGFLQKMVKEHQSQGKTLVVQYVWPFIKWSRFIFLVFPLLEEKCLYIDIIESIAYQTLSRNATCHVYWKINIQVESINTKQEYYNVQTNNLPKRYCISLWE